MTGTMGWVVRRATVCVGLTLTTAGGVLAQTSTNTGSSSDRSSPPKQALAVGIDSDLITIDGRLDDAAWREAHFFADLLQGQGRLAIEPETQP